MLHCLLQGNTVPVELEGNISVHYSIAMHFSKEQQGVMCALSLTLEFLDNVALSQTNKYFFHLYSSVVDFVFCFFVVVIFF